MLNFQLHPKQQTALQSSATEILYGGAAGGGKSHLMRIAAIMWCALIPGLQVYLFRRTFPDLIKNHMEGPSSFPVLLADWIAAKWVKINFSDNVIHFWNGSVIHLAHCQHEKDVYKYQGAEIHVLMMDELTHFTEKIYRFLRNRVRMAGIALPREAENVFPRVLCSSNPGGVGHNWVKQTFVDIAAPMRILRMDKSEGGMLRQYIPAKLADNPTLLESDPGYVDRLEGLGNAALVKAMLDGDWNIVAGGMFDDIWTPNKHIIEAFPIPQSWLIDRSFDWGSSKPFSVGWWAESDGSDVYLNDDEFLSFPKGTLFRIAEWYGWNGKANEGLRMLSSEIARGIREREKKMGLLGWVKPGPADSSIFTNEDGKCIADEMALQNVKWAKADKSPGSRISGWEKMRTMLKASLQHPMEEPGMYIFDNCTQFIRTIPTLPRDDVKTDDVDTNSEDHVGDEARYRATFKRKSVKSAKVVGL